MTPPPLTSPKQPRQTLTQRPDLTTKIPNEASTSSSTTSNASFQKGGQTATRATDDRLKLRNNSSPISPNRALLVRSTPCEQRSAHIAEDAGRAIEDRVVDRICYRFMQAHRDKNDYGNSAVIEASQAMFSLAVALAQPGSVRLTQGAIATIYSAFALPHVGVSRQLSGVVSQCRESLSKLLGDEFAKDLYKLKLNEAGLEQAIAMLRAHRPPIETSFLERKLDEMRSPNYVERLKALEVVQDLVEKIIGDNLPDLPPAAWKSLSEDELRQHIEDMPKRLGQVLSIAAIAGGHLDLLLAASLLGVPGQSVEECAAELEARDFLKNGSIADQFLIDVVKKDIPSDKLERAEQRIAQYYSSPD